MALYYYGDHISDNIIEAPNGVLICRNVPIGRTGIQKYHAKDLALADKNPFDIVDVNRKEDDVFDAATLASFEGMAVTDGHPDEDVNMNNWGIYAKGHVQNVHRGKGEDSDKIVADLFITDNVLADKIRNKLKREVSSGYQCMYAMDEEGSIQQKNIRGNHVAVVDAGRAGPSVAIKDSLPEETKQIERRKPLMALKKGPDKIRGILGLVTKSARDAQSVEDIESIVTDAATAISDMMTVDAEVVPSEPAPAIDMDTLVAKLSDQMSTMIDAKMSEYEKGKEEQRKAGKELAKGDKEVKKAEDAISPSIESMAARQKATSLETLLTHLIGDEDEVMDAEESVTVTASADSDNSILKFTGKSNKASKDAAIEIINGAKDAIARIADADDRKMVTDALTRSILNQLSTDGQSILDAVASGATATMVADGAPGMETYDKINEQMQSAYDKLNPHING